MNYQPQAELTTAIRAHRTLDVTAWDDLTIDRIGLAVMQERAGLVLMTQRQHFDLYREAQLSTRWGPTLLDVIAGARIVYR